MVILQGHLFLHIRMGIARMTFCKGFAFWYKRRSSLDNIIIQQYWTFRQEFSEAFLAHEGKDRSDHGGKSEFLKHEQGELA
jgi:hypothetical protein